MLLCRLCGNAGKFVKAHIIPEAFFRVLREGGATPLLVTGTPNQFPKRSPIGVYDEGILCDACEPKFDRFDHYGVETLLVRLDELFQPISHQGEIIAYQSAGVDQKLLMQFLLATMWRASVSTHLFYRRVNLGPFEAIARRAILEPEEPVPESFNAVLSRWTIEEQHQQSAGGLMDPFRERWDGVNAYRFYFGHVVAYIKADRQNFVGPLRHLALQNGPSVTMATRSFDKSSDFAAMMHTAKRSHDNLTRARAARAIPESRVPSDGKTP
mgnify:FL=1